jgi:flagellar hook-length control protein FliK
MTQTHTITNPHRTAESGDFSRRQQAGDGPAFDITLARSTAQSPHVRAVIDAPQAERASVVTDTGADAVERVQERVAREGSLSAPAQQAKQQLTEAAGKSPAAEQPPAKPQQQQRTSTAQPHPAAQPPARADQPSQQPQPPTQQAPTPAPAAEPAHVQTNGQPSASQTAPDQPVAGAARQPSSNQQHGQQHQPQARPASVTATQATAKPAPAQPPSAFAASLKSAAQQTRSRVATAQQSPYKFDQAKLEAQAARGLAAALKQRGGVVNMKLNPASLGTLKVRVEIRNGSVDATFETSTAKARELLESNLTSLRAALETRGLTVEKLSIAEQPAPDAPDRGVGDDRGSEDRQAEDRPNAGHQGAGRAATGSHATDGEPIPDDPAVVALGERAHSSVGGAGIAIRLDTVV